MTYHDESDTFTKPFGHELADKSRDVPELAATEFEKARGVNSIDRRTGFCGVLVRALELPTITIQRLAVLKVVKDAEISIDFVKFTSDGISFLVPSADEPKVQAALNTLKVEYTTKPDRTVLTVHAVNMRDEEGLVARVVSEVIASGAEIDHMGDMHDRLLIVMSEADAKTAANSLKSTFPEAVATGVN